MACGQQKVKGGNGSSSASSSASSIPLNLGVGCAPSCWPIFGFRTSWVLAGGAEGSFLCSPSSRFSGRGGGVGSLPRAWRRVGVPKGGNGSISASISTSLIASLITLNLGVGCAPSCWPIFGFRNLLGARRGLRGQFSVQSDNRFSGRGGGGGNPLRRCLKNL